jgi:hypothetical protein
MTLWWDMGEGTLTDRQIKRVLAEVAAGIKHHLTAIMKRGQGVDMLRFPTNKIVG